MNWREIPLGKVVQIRIAHDHDIVQFKGKELTEEQKESQALNLDTDDDENKWLCNGADEEEGFMGGCKGGQTEFGYHEGTEGWQNPDTQHFDFDLCEMCVRWCIHCERTGTDLGLIKD